MNGEQNTHFHPQSGFFIWDGPFNERHVPEQAGFKFHTELGKWATASPFVAYMLAPELPELQHIRSRIRASKARESAIVIPLPDGRTLRPFQIAGVAFCRSRRVSYNGDDMGVGKSIQAIAQANIQGHQKCLVICPAHLRVNWQREVEDWFIGNPAAWSFISYEHAANNASRLKQSGPYDFLVLDECHYLKEATSERSRRILGTSSIEPLTRFAKQILLLSGTPLPNRVTECWTLLRALNPTAIQDCLSFFDFASRFSHLVPDGEGGFTPRGSRNEAELSVRLRGTFFIRRTKAEVLPQLDAAKRYQMVILEPDGETEKVLAKEAPFSASEIIKHGVPDGSPLAEIRREMGLAKLPAALRYIESVLEGQPGKLAVFAYHRDMLLELHAVLRARYGAVLVIGGLGDRKRQEAVDAFQGDSGTRVFIGQLTAAGTGLTLTAAARLIRVEASWVPGENQQVEDRVARLGQEADELLVEDLVVRGSLDAMILGSAARKSGSTGKVLDGGQI